MASHILISEVSIIFMEVCLFFTYCCLKRTDPRVLIWTKLLLRSVGTLQVRPGVGHAVLQSPGVIETNMDVNYVKCHYLINRFWIGLLIQEYLGYSKFFLAIIIAL